MLWTWKHIIISFLQFLGANYINGIIEYQNIRLDTITYYLIVTYLWMISKHIQSKLQIIYNL